jgi:hypothetical protein
MELYCSISQDENSSPQKITELQDAGFRFGVKIEI